MINTTFRRLSDLRNNKEFLSSYKYKRENTLRILDFIAFNHCYFCPMSIKGKYPFKDYSWSSSLIVSDNKEDKAKTIKMRRHTIALNKIIMRLLKKNHELNTSDLNRGLSILYLMLSYDSYSINLGESRLFVFDCDVFNHNSNDSSSASSNQFIDSYGKTLNFCIGLKKLCKWFIRNKLDLSILENTYTVLTTSGGLHFYFKFPDSVSMDEISMNGVLKAYNFDKAKQIKSQGQQSNKKDKSLTGVCDFLTGNHVVIAPYSLKIKGNTLRQYKPIRISLERAHIGYFSYTTEIEPHKQISILSPDLISCIKGRIKDIRKKSTLNNIAMFTPLADESFTPTDSESKHAENIYRKQLKKLDECREGERISTLISVSYTIGKVFKYLDYPLSLIQSVLTNTALKIGLNERETRDAVKNGLNRGMAEPFQF